MYVETLEYMYPPNFGLPITIPGDFIPLPSPPPSIVRRSRTSRRSSAGVYIRHRGISEHPHTPHAQGGVAWPHAPPSPCICTVRSTVGHERHCCMYNPSSSHISYYVVASTVHRSCDAYDVISQFSSVQFSSTVRCTLCTQQREL